ncbi:MAG: ATP-binding protein [Candidatus Electrothrix sp. EH2]|nr:ATP-binding protein [Candidatus Electrothrix sp. EH2]
MHLLLANISSLISYRKAENDFKSRGMRVSSSTLAKFAGYLEEAFFGTFLEIHAESVRKRQTNPKKFYLVDQGLHNFLTLSFSANKGRVLENIVFLELRRKGIQTRYYKTTTDQEIDFLAMSEGKQQLIQVCYTMRHLETAEREQRALLKGMDELDHQKGLIVTADQKEVLEIHGKQIHFCPVYEWLLDTDD